MGWNDERVELLKKLWADGLSASQIAAELGGITRNAVIGKVHRLGLSGRVKAPSMSQPRPRAPKPMHAQSRPAMKSHNGPMTRGANALAYAPRVETLPARRPVEEVVIPMSERVTIMELRESMCRWPLGDPTTPEFRFCGARSITGLPYCTHHAEIAYQPATERKRDRRAAGFR